jgi:hypothetical protein
MALCVGVVALACGVTTPAAERGEAHDRLHVPDLQDAGLTQYRAYRRMHVRNDRFNQESWLECWTELGPEGFSYEIVSERGSESLRDKVLRTLLRREQELVAAGQTGRAEMTSENYEFADGGSSPDGERQILLKPKRKDVLLVDGRMVLTEDGTELRRVEGRLAKNPSFWTSLVNIVRSFARINGARVPVYTETVARVKLAGVSRMDVRYDYETINGRPVSEAARDLIASAAR